LCLEGERNSYRFGAVKLRNKQIEGKKIVTEFSFLGNYPFKCKLNVIFYAIACYLPLNENVF